MGARTMPMVVMGASGMGRGRFIGWGTGCRLRVALLGGAGDPVFAGGCARAGGTVRPRCGRARLGGWETAATGGGVVSEDGGGAGEERGAGLGKKYFLG